MHLYTRLPSDWGARPGRRSISSPKSSREEGGSTQANLAFIVIGVVIGVLIIAAIAIHFIRNKRKRKAAPSSTQQSRPDGWKRFLSPFRSEPGRYQATSGDDSAELDHTPGRTRRAVEERNNAPGNRNSAAAVDRNTSVRSVLTLPAYSRAAANNEQVIGREGERDGVDVVVDYQTEQDLEALRETEMDALYQLRAARRQQVQEREELRRQRREAQQRQDYAALSDIRSRARAASNSNNDAVEELRRDIDQAKENRQRSASSVSYAELGVARHDGTRLRASSQESERMGLLADAADMGNAPRSGANSPMPQQLRSASPVISVDGDFPSPGLSRTQDRSSAASRLSYPGGRAGSSPELVESDLGVEAMPPPEYENVSLDDDDNIARSTTPMHEPPPDYPGPYRSDSGRSQRSAGRPASVGTHPSPDRDDEARGRGVGGIPQLPSLRIGRLPTITVEPSSAHPRDGNGRE